MVRKAVIALALLPVSAFAQSSTTNCQKDYFGNVTCQTNQNPGIDWSKANQGTVLQSGANSVPNYAEQQMRQRELRLRERELQLREQAARDAAKPAPPPAAFPPPTSLTGKYGVDAERKAYLDTVLMYCRTGAPLKDVAADQQMITGALCYAFDQGRIDEITRSK